jgi:hypothetical protein
MKISQYTYRRGCGASIIAFLLTALPNPAFAHFLWAQIVSGENPKPTLKITFAEQPGEKTLANLMPRLKPTRFHYAGKTDPLPSRTTEGALLADLPAKTTIAGTEQIWGVLDRREQKRGVFLLHYHARAAATNESAQKPSGLAVEALATQSGNRVTVEIRQDDWTVPNVPVTLHTNGTILAATTDLAGKATFTLPQTARGVCGIRAEITDNTPGKHDGKDYELVRHYTTLTFPLNSTTEVAQQTVRQIVRGRGGVRTGSQCHAVGIVSVVAFDRSCASPATGGTAPAN